MAKVEILPSLEKAIYKQFKKESIQVLEYIKTLENSPKKGKPIGRVGGLAIKELKYKNYRFYFLADAYEIRVLDVKELQDILLQFVRMSNKKEQQKVIDEIRNILITLGPQGFII